jgi:hypothetical protein
MSKIWKYKELEKNMKISTVQYKIYNHKINI